MFEPQAGLPVRPRGPLIKSREQYERYLRYAWADVARLAPPAEADERRLIENLRGEAMRTLFELAARHEVAVLAVTCRSARAIGPST